MTRLLLLINLLLFAFPLHAEWLAIYPYDSARVITVEEGQGFSYKLALGPYEKKDSRWQPEKSQRLRGLLQRQTHELLSGFDEHEVFQFYREQLPNGAKVLFNCERRDCGESNNWANDHFRIKQLYGLDQYQFYGVYQVDENHYITLYTVRRGNRRVYIQIDQLIAEDKGPS